MPLTAGVARACITPYRGVELTGWGYYLQRRWQGIHDHLFATALVLADAREAVVLISVDLMVISEAFTRQVRESVKQILDAAMDAGLDGPQAATWFYANQRARRWAAARRNVGWHWVIDPLQQPCWTYLAWSADPEDQNDTGLIRDVMDAALPGTSKLPTVGQMAYEARHRRVASNRLVRGGMKVYDRIKSGEPVHIQEQMLQVLQPELTHYIREAEDLLPPFITAEEADQWLAPTPWHDAQQELFWSAATLAMWCQQFLAQPPAIGRATVAT